MSMDDTPDKVRRNAVTFSAAIIGMSFLQVKIEKLGILGIELTGISSLRACIALLVVLIYLFLRYHFDENTGEEWDLAKKAFILARAPYIALILSKDALSMLEKGSSLRHLTNERWITDDFNAVQKQAGQFTHATMQATSPSNFSERIGSTQLTAIFHRSRTDGDHWAALHRSSEYKLPKHIWYLRTAQTALRQAIYSRSSVNVFLPYILAASAAVILVSKIIDGLLLSL